jgi:hypothetical protein
VVEVTLVDEDAVVDTVPEVEEEERNRDKEFLGQVVLKELLRK